MMDYKSIIRCIYDNNKNELEKICNKYGAENNWLIKIDKYNKFLISAIKNKSKDVIQFLLDNNFDIYLKNSRGMCAFDHALRSHNPSILNLFINHSNKIKQQLLNVPETFLNINTQFPIITNPLLSKLQLLNLPDNLNTLIKEKIKNTSSLNKEGLEWIDNFFKIPFNKYANLIVNKKNNTLPEIRNYFINVKEQLDNASYGMDNVKEEITDIVCQLISSQNSNIKIIGLCGSAGVGKTNFIKNGLSKILNRPFEHLCMGGLNDSSYLLGHSSAYTNSRYGIIVNSLMKTKVMNPIIFMDELDKISNCEKGKDIQNVLIHITDPVQNNCFMDKYFQGIEFDLSKVIFIFSFNDENNIDKILRDRIHIIHVKDPSVDDKINIAHKFLIPSILNNINLHNIIFTNKQLRYIIENYCNRDVGVRSLKRNIETILLKINTSIYNPCIKYKSLKKIINQLDTGIKITDDMIEEILIRNDPEIDTFSHMYM